MYPLQRHNKFLSLGHTLSYTATNNTEFDDHPVQYTSAIQIQYSFTCYGYNYTKVLDARQIQCDQKCMICYKFCTKQVKLLLMLRLPTSPATATPATATPATDTSTTTSATTY